MALTFHLFESSRFLFFIFSKAIPTTPHLHHVIIPSNALQKPRSFPNFHNPPVPFTTMHLLLLLVSAASLASALPSNPKAQVLDCLQIAGIPDDLPASPHFAALETPFNIRLNYTPSVIVTPKTEQELALAVKCASGTGVKVQARSGGHSYASFSMGGE